MDRNQIIQNSIVSDMSEGVMTIRFNGVIEQVNDAALAILEKKEEELTGNTFLCAFFGSEENDAFIQCVLDAVYEKGKRKENYVPYQTTQGVKQLRVVSSCLHERGEMIGVLLVISDITELTEMRDAVRAMEKIQDLNRQLELRNRVLQETFGRYLSDDVVKEILESPGGWKLGGQRQKLTVLMSDLRGFTAMSERMKPQDLINMLNHYFGEMYEEIERYRGTLIEFMGDGMLVVFGAPTWRENHASDAVAAAVGMQKRMEAVNRWNLKHGYEELAMGIGINSDEMILGNIGSEKRTKYGVLGAAVNLAGRIESYTTGGQILISPGTREAVREELNVRQTLSVSPKGVGGEILLSDIAGIGAPYNLRLNVKYEALTTLPAPVPVRFARVEGKHTEDSWLEGSITAASEDEALLDTGEALSALDNLLLKIGGNLYAKVTQVEQGSCRITFTAKPPRFAEWFEQLIQVNTAGGEGGEASDFTLTVLGTRGSMAVGGPEYSEYGGSTSCYLVQAGKESIFLDAGSGLLSAPGVFPKPPAILLSHLHLDHVIGLGMFPRLSQKGKECSLYVPFCEDGQQAKAEINRLFAPPFWPVTLDKLGADLHILPVTESFRIGEVQVETMPGSHPGGSVVYKLSYKGRSIVYATDYEHGETTDEKLAAFSKNADLLLYDAQFEEEEYAHKKGFGHSTAQRGMKLLEQAGVRRLLFVHHDTQCSDRVLRQREAEWKSDRIAYAKEGQLLIL